MNKADWYLFLCKWSFQFIRLNSGFHHQLLILIFLDMEQLKKKHRIPSFFIIYLIIDIPLNLIQFIMVHSASCTDVRYRKQKRKTSYLTFIKDKFVFMWNKLEAFSLFWILFARKKMQGIED